VTRLPLVVAVTTMEVAMPTAVVLSAAGTVGLTQTGAAAVVLALRMEAAVVTAELVMEEMR